MNRPITTRRRAATILITAASVLGGALAAPLAGAQVRDVERSGHTPRTTTERNRLVAERVVEALGRGDSRIVREVFAENFVDHSTSGDRAALIAATNDQRAASPRSSARVYRVVVDGDLAFVHSNLVLRPHTRGFAVADIFRFENGRIAERWTARQAVPAVTASGNDMFSTLSTPRRLAPDPAADPAATRGVMFGLFGTIVGARDLTAYDTFLQEPYYQHSTNTPNGIAAVKAIWGPILIDPALQIDFVASLAEGDLFVSYSVLHSPSIAAIAVDISRVRNDKVVEHWDVVQPLT